MGSRYVEISAERTHPVSDKNFRRESAFPFLIVVVGVLYCCTTLKPLLLILISIQ